MAAPLYFVATDVPFVEVFNPTFGDPVAHALRWWSDQGLMAVVSDHGGRIAAAAARNGPGGVCGVWVCAWPEHAAAPQPLGYMPDRQMWVQVRPEVWVGWPTDQRPEPDDFDNGNPWHVSGPELQFYDGRRWQVPEIREPMSGGQLLLTESQTPRLPRLMKRGMSGELIRPVRSQFRELWDASGQWFDQWLELSFGHRTAYNGDDALDYCLRVMQLRYRVCDYANDALDIIDNSDVEQIIEASLGWAPVFSLLQSLSGSDPDDTAKKNDRSDTPLMPSGDCGQEESGRSTDQHAESSISQVADGGGA